MDLFSKTLFEYYGEVVLNDLGCGFNGETLQEELAGFIPDEAIRSHMENVAFDHYYRWASTAFGIGLRLGLSFSNDDIRRPGLEQA